MPNMIEVINKIDSIARARGCEVEQVAISMERGEAALVFYSPRSELYSSHSYAWFDGEELRDQTHWGAYDLTLDGARRVWTEKARRFMEGWK